LRIEDRDLPSSILDPRSSILNPQGGIMSRRSFSAGSTKFLSFILIIALAVPALSSRTRDETSNQAAAWTPELSMKVRAVGGVQVSPDGKRVLYTVNEPVMTTEKSEYLTQVWTASASGGDAYQMTFSEKSSTNPDWSPDGRWIAFTSSRSGKNNLYLMRSTGGEAEMITDVKSGVVGFAWSPDGKRVAFTMADPPTTDEEKNNKGKDDSRWIDENVKMNHLYVISIEKDGAGKREPRQLTKGAFTVGSGLGGDGAFDWSPDGKSIVFTQTKTLKADDWTSANVSVVDVASGEIKAIATTAAAESQPIYSPDGKWIALTVSDAPPTWAFQNRINILSAGGGAPKPLAPTFDEQPNLIGWAADGKRIYFTETRGTTTAISAINVETGAVTDIENGRAVYSAINLNHARAMFGLTMQNNGAAVEAYVTPADNFALARVSAANADLPKPPLGKMEVVRWKSGDGMETEGILNYPINYKAGQRVPLLLVIHGGPTGVFTQNFAAGPGLYPTAVFNARGYAVLRANPRGSSGYGRKFRYANYKDWGGGDYRDLMAGVDHVISMGVADPDRLGVMGWSYGGFMTSWVITQTKRFKAASIGAAVTNLMSFTGTADIPGFIPDYMGAQFWDNLEVYRQHSAMFNIKGASTPSLIQHCEGDLRVPISQGYELYNALKQQGVPVRMLVMPRQAHGPTEPKMLLKIMQTNVEWFDKMIGGAS
jgi:dipeptidyl aminopeptidase/acylaminoacyl peptidase